VEKFGVREVLKGPTGGMSESPTTVATLGFEGRVRYFSLLRKGASVGGNEPPDGEYYSCQGHLYMLPPFVGKQAACKKWFSRFSAEFFLLLSCTLAKFT